MTSAGLNDCPFRIDPMPWEVYCSDEDEGDEEGELYFIDDGQDD